MAATEPVAHTPHRDAPPRRIRVRPESEPTEDQVTISAPRIAVLEDDHAFREVLLAILDDQHLAWTALDPRDGAIAQLLEQRPHIAIIDWHLGGMGSAETAEELL